MSDPIKPAITFADRYKNLFNLAAVVAASLGGAYFGMHKSHLDTRYLIKEVQLDSRQGLMELTVRVDKFAESTEKRLIAVEKQMDSIEERLERQRLEAREDMQHLRGYKTR